MPIKNLDRREFIQAASVSAAAISLPRTNQIRPNDRMKVAFIGSGGRGGRNMQTMADTSDALEEFFLDGCTMDHTIEVVDDRSEQT